MLLFCILFVQKGFHFKIHIRVLYGLTVICDPFILLSLPQSPGLSNYPVSLHLCHDSKGTFAWEIISILPPFYPDVVLNYGNSRLVSMLGYSKSALPNTAGTTHKRLLKTCNVASPN